MAIYVIVFKTKDNKQVVLSAMNDGYSHFFSNYKDAVKSLSSVVKSLEHLLDGEPEKVGNMLRGYEVVRKFVSDEDREKWSVVLETLEIKKVSGIKLTDGTEISKEGDLE